MSEQADIAKARVFDGKYARVERERRFLLAQAPPPASVTARYRITDRYVEGTRLRLRCAEDLHTGLKSFKFTQKVPAHQPGATRGLITTIYLDQREYDLLSALPAAVLSKTRVSVPPLGVDLFDPPFDGLVIAEAEFVTDAAAQSFVPPSEAVAEVTDDARFEGGNLARASRHELLAWRAEYGVVSKQF